jgi:hypothetical protein
MSLNDPIPYEPTRKFTEFVQVEEEVEEELPSKVKYSIILQEEEYEAEEEDFFRDK